MSDAEPGRRSRLVSGGLVAAVIVLTSVVCIIILRGHPLIGDETFHYRAIRTFLRHKWPSDLPMFPAYHMVLAEIGRLLHVRSLDGFRMLSVIPALLSVVVFHLCARTLDPSTAASRTVQFFFLPYLFPLRYLVYTEGLSFLLLLSAVLAALRGRLGWAGIAGTAAIVIRQVNVVWLVFLLAMTYVDAYGFRPSAPSMRAHLRKCWSFILGGAVFALFVAWNRGPIMSSSPAVLDQMLTGRFPLHTGNAFFSLFVLFTMLLPLIVARTPEMLRRLGHDRRLWFALGIILAVYLLTFRVNHPWNRSDGYYLMNLPIDAARSHWPYHLLLILPMTAAFLLLATTRLERPSLSLLYVFAVLELVPCWLINVRYEIPAISLYLLFRRLEQPRLERLTTAYLAVLSAANFGGIVLEKFFL